MASLLGAPPRVVGSSIQESLKQIEAFFINQEKSTGNAMYNRDTVYQHIDTAVFSGAEMHKRNAKNRHLSIHEFELANEICTFCSRQKKDFIRYCTFDSLFSMSRPTVKDFRLYILSSVVSMAIGQNIESVLDCAALWLITTERDNALYLATVIYNDYCLTMPDSSTSLKNCVECCPQFVCVLLSVFCTKFSLQGTSQNSFPDASLFHIILHWLMTDNNICHRIIVIKDQNFHRWCATYRPTLQYPISLSPLSGLISWSVKSPLSQSELSISVGGSDQNPNLKAFFNEHLQSKFQYTILKALLTTPSCQANICKSMLSTEPDFQLWSLDDVHALLGDILSYCTTGNTDEFLEKAVDRFAQISQIAITSGVLKCSLREFQSLTDPLPKTKLMEIVAYGPQHSSDFNDVNMH